jgi:hypothetical protein
VFSGECVSEETVRHLYGIAAEGEFGVAFKLLCSGEDVSYCYLYAPSELQEAEQRLLFFHRIKCMVPSVVPSAKIIKRWSFLSFWYQLKEIHKLRWKCYAFSQKWIYEKTPSRKNIPEILQDRSSHEKTANETHSDGVAENP